MPCSSISNINGKGMRLVIYNLCLLFLLNSSLLSTQRCVHSGGAGIHTLWCSAVAYTVFPSTDSTTPRRRAMVFPCWTTSALIRIVVPSKCEHPNVSLIGHNPRDFVAIQSTNASNIPPGIPLRYEMFKDLVTPARKLDKKQHISIRCGSVRAVVGWGKAILPIPRFSDRVHPQSGAHIYCLMALTLVLLDPRSRSSGSYG